MLVLQLLWGDMYNIVLTNARNDSFQAAQFSGLLNLHAGAGTRCGLIAEQYWCTIVQITAIQFSFGTIKLRVRRI